MITKNELAQMIDHTNLKAYATDADMKKLCEEAKEYNFKMVAINSGQSKRCSEYLKGTSVHTGAAIGFPLGQQSIENKVFETLDAISNGANEIDYVINITELKEKNYAYIEEEMTRMVNACHAYSICCKVIFENCYLEKDEIAKMAEIAAKVKPDFIKTSTGFGTSGATLEDVKIMADGVRGTSVQIKAAGGVRDLETALKFIELGVTRIGTSAGISILAEMK
ncbi:MAG: deoxyribose-phosphate aldolase [Erysipelotrichaceae bacterium]